MDNIKENQMNTKIILEKLSSLMKSANLNFSVETIDKNFIMNSKEMHVYIDSEKCDVTFTFNISSDPSDSALVIASLKDVKEINNIFIAESFYRINSDFYYGKEAYQKYQETLEKHCLRKQNSEKNILQFLEKCVPAGSC